MKFLKSAVLGLALLCSALVASAAGMSNFLENELSDHMMRARAYSPAATRCVALYTAAPSDTGGGTEATYTGYARGQLDASATNWKGTGGETTATDSTGTSGTVSNNAIITVGAAATSGPQVVTHFGVFDACSGGNLLFWAALTASKTVNNGDPAPTFAVDALTIQTDN